MELPSTKLLESKHKEPSGRFKVSLTLTINYLIHDFAFKKLGVGGGTSC